MLDTDVINITVNRPGHTVLVVDDNDATRYSTARTLRAAGFKTREAASGQEAVTLSEQGVSAVVLDVHLPDLDGFEVCRFIRSRDSTEHLPVVHLSATHVANEDKVTGLNAGADAYLVHPAEPAVLIATVQALIRARTAEEAVRRSEQRFRAIYDHAQCGIALLTASGSIVDANPTMLKFLGHTRDSLAGVAIASLTHGEGAGEPEWKALSEGQEWHGEFPLFHSDGSSVYLEWNISQPIDDGLRIAVATDISARHDIEERRREVLEREKAARAAAEQHNRTKDNFIAVLSHELRTPLNAIVGWVAVLMRRNPTAEAKTGLEAIDRNVKAQARLISDILDVSRINSGKLLLELEEVDPAQVLRAALAGLQGSIAEKSIQLHLDMAPAPASAFLDPDRFQQVIWNLVTNAIKFSAAGGAVYVTLSQSGPDLVLTVRDEGQGIAPEFLPRLFDRFTQSAEPGNRRHGGLGLGLSIVKHITDLHGGDVFAHSAGTGMGTTMEVRLPVRGPQNAEIPDAEELFSPDPAKPHGRPLEGVRILIVEDDKDACEMLSVVLADRGADVRMANDYDSALRDLRVDWPDVMVSDIGLPGRDGYELIRAARELTPPPGAAPWLPAIALTAFAREEDRERSIEAGFDAHVAKPLKPHTLVAAVRSVIAPRDDQRA